MILYIKLSYEGDGIIQALIHCAFRHASLQTS